MYIAIIAVLALLAIVLLVVNENALKKVAFGVGGFVVAVIVFIHFVKQVTFDGPVAVVAGAFAIAVVMFVFTLHALLKK
ncbi:MAG: hypothetical protein IJH12_04035 [Clostridia bacterium]|nr:hypothetical protein [Clostridia bacterium]